MFFPHWAHEDPAMFRKFYLDSGVFLLSQPSQPLYALKIVALMVDKKTKLYLVPQSDKCNFCNRQKYGKSQLP